MNPLLILLVGMFVVIGGVLVLRLHAFLALILGALVVGALTSRDQVLSNQIAGSAVEVVSVDDGGQAGGSVVVSTALGGRILHGENFVLPGAQRDTSAANAPIGSVTLGPSQPVSEADSADLRRCEIVSTDGEVQLQPGDRLIHHTLLASARGTAGSSFAARAAVGFGNAAGNIGIIIAMAAIIGKCLLDSGGAERIVLALRNLLGEQRAPQAFLTSGFILAIPVFFDTVFYLMLPLGKAMFQKSGKHYVLYVLTIVAGATMAHSLVPPTPGPLFVAESLDVNLGLMMIGGILVGMCTVTAGYFYARWADARWEIPLRPSADLTEEELREMRERDESTLPPLGWSLLPILLPVLLIAGAAVVKTTYDGVAAADRPAWYGLTQTLGDKNLALILGGAVALGLLVQRNSGLDLAQRVQTALASGGIIILITSAGGAFGHVLRQTDIAGAITTLMPSGGLDYMLLPLAFTLTTLVRIAQGSATVAMITVVGIVAPVAAGIELSYHPLYLALAIGSGSKPFPWMNDSGFWIISKMSGFTEGETLKASSVMIAIMGVVGLVVTMIGAWLLPMNAA